MTYELLELLMASNPSDIIFTSLLVLNRTPVHKDLHSLIIGYLFETKRNDVEEWYTINGINHGIKRVWYKNGHVKVEYNYKDGELNGSVRTWRENGQLWEEYNFKDGETHGLYREWHENDQLTRECNYKDGKRHGICRLWNKNGDLWAECNYIDDIPSALE